MAAFKLSALVLAALLLGTPASFAAERTWSFVDTIGGLQVGVPSKGPSGWTFPISADVSEQKQSAEPSASVPTGLVCSKTLAEVEPNSIYISIVTNGAGSRPESSKCPDVLLPSDIAAGAYTVYYRGKYEDEGSVFHRTESEEPVKLSEVLIGAD